MKVVIDNNVLINALEAMKNSSSSNETQLYSLKVIELAIQNEFSLRLTGRLIEQYNLIDKHFNENRNKYNSEDVNKLFTWIKNLNASRTDADEPRISNKKDHLLFHGALLEADYLITSDKDIIKMNHRLSLSRKAITPEDFIKLILN